MYKQIRYSVVCRLPRGNANPPMMHADSDDPQTMIYKLCVVTTVLGFLPARGNTLFEIARREKLFIISKSIIGKMIKYNEYMINIELLCLFPRKYFNMFLIYFNFNILLAFLIC